MCGVRMAQAMYACFFIDARPLHSLPEHRLCTSGAVSAPILAFKEVFFRSVIPEALTYLKPQAFRQVGIAILFTFCFFYQYLHHLEFWVLSIQVGIALSQPSLSSSASKGSLTSVCSLINLSYCFYLIVTAKFAHYLLGCKRRTTHCSYVFFGATKPNYMG